MKYAYIVRQPTDDTDFSRWYCIKFVDGFTTHHNPRGNHRFVINIDEARPPVLRKRSAGGFVWDYANKPVHPRDFHKTYPHIRLKPGEGPILVDLDDTTTRRTSRHPDD